MRCSLTYADFADKESSPNFRVLRYVLKESFAYVRTRIQQRFRFFAVTSVTAGEKMEFYSLPLKVLFCKKRRVTFRKTTGHFSKNDGSLFEKRRVVCWNSSYIFLLYLLPIFFFELFNKSSTPCSFLTLRTTKILFLVAIWRYSTQ